MTHCEDISLDIAADLLSSHKKEALLKKLGCSTACIWRGILLRQKREFQAGIRLLEKHSQEFADANNLNHAKLLEHTMEVLQFVLAEIEARFRTLEKHPDTFEDEFHGDFFLVLVGKGKTELGKLLFKEQNFEMAVPYLEAALNVWKGKELYQVHHSLGISYARMRNHSKAEEHLNTCISLYPTSEPHVYLQLEVVRLESARYQEADIQDFAQSADASQSASDFVEESRLRWLAGAIAAKQCRDLKQAAQHLTMSLEAALKIQEPHLQARMLPAAIIWLTECFPNGNAFASDLDVKLLRLRDKSLSNEWQPLKTLQAEGYGTLGMAKQSYQAYDDAQELLGRAISLLTEGDYPSGTKEYSLRYMFRLSSASNHLLLHAYQKAFDAFQECLTEASSEKHKLYCDISSCFALNLMGKSDTSAAAFARLEDEYSSLVDSNINLKVLMLLGWGQALYMHGNKAEGTERLEYARRVLEDRGCFSFDLLARTYNMLHTALKDQGLFSAAVELQNSLEEVIREHHHAGSRNVNERFFNVHLAAADTSTYLSDYQTSRNSLTKLVERGDIKGQKLRCSISLALADVYRHQNDLDAAENKYNEALSILPQGDAALAAEIYMQRADLYKLKGERAADQDTKMEMNSNALHDYNQCIAISREEPERISEQNNLDLLLATCHSQQAIIRLPRDDLKAMREKKAAHMMDYARSIQANIEVMGDGHAQLPKATAKGGLAQLLLLASQLTNDEEKLEQAIQHGEEAALMFAEGQLRLEGLETTWLTLHGGSMKAIYFLLQEACILSLQYHKRHRLKRALLWGERGRFRLYFHQAGIQRRAAGDSLDDPLLFDKDCDYAWSYIAATVSLCGPGCVFMEYTVCPEKKFLYIYVVREVNEELMLNCKRVLLKDVLTGSIEALVRRTRSDINRRFENKAKSGLGVLYSLLVKPVWNLIKEYKTIFFAPTDSMWLVPFAALYDEESSQFLIEKKEVGTIPSLRALGLCQLRYKEAGMKAQGAGFVAGDPEPMGFSYSQLPGARQEAIEVAKQLGVAPLIGRDVTKEAVIQGLKSDARVILLVTHGVVKNSHPQGVLVMRSMHHQQQQEMVDIERLVFRRCLSPQHLSRAAESAIIQERSTGSSEELLTADEIKELEIHAALVVLSACQTGEGEVSSEGLRALHTAVLQAGASCVVATLWRVDDMATQKLMTGMFREVVDNNRSVVAGLQLSMLELLRSGAPVHQWASATALGYSMLKLSE